MLVTRQCEIGRNTWSSSKLEAIYKDVAPPRMSNFEPLPTQPDWREQYSPFTLPGDTGILQPSFEQSANSDALDNGQNQQQQNATQSHLEPRHNFDAIQRDVQPSALAEQLDVTSGNSGNQMSTSRRDDSLISTESRPPQPFGTLGNPTSTGSSQPGTSVNDDNGHLELKEEEDELDDDEMIDAEDGAMPPQTAAERRAERRKMKRFRYNLQNPLLHIQRY